MLNIIKFYGFVDFSLVFRILLGWYIILEEILIYIRVRYIVWMVKD